MNMRDLYAVGVVVLATPFASAAIFSMAVENHPDANQDPPPYGLRLDELFLQAPEVGSVVSGIGGATTFSFDAADGASVVLGVDLVGSSLVISMSGQVYGGVDTGTTYGFGEGLYNLDFSWSMNVSEVTGPNGGWIADPGSTINQGTLTSVGNADVAAGTSWRFYQQVAGSAAKFLFLRDEHRLGSYPSLAALDPWVGRGWVTYDAAGANSAGTQDFIFLAVPAPGAIGVLGAAGLMMTRRRR